MPDVVESFKFPRRTHTPKQVPSKADLQRFFDALGSLRDKSVFWFCCQLGELGVPDRYVDAFCGRIPKSVLAKHYRDYSPEKLKRIYDKANLTTLT